MTENQYLALICGADRLANHTGFMCSHECPYDFFYHAEALLTYLHTLIDAEFWRDENTLEIPVLVPDCPCDLYARFVAEGETLKEKMRSLCAA